MGPSGVQDAGQGDVTAVRPYLGRRFIRGLVPGAAVLMLISTLVFNPSALIAAPVQVAALTLATAGPPPAAQLGLKRGMNLEIWVDWIEVEEMVASPDFLDQYPDWLRHVKPERIAALKAAGFDFVRFPVEPAPLLLIGPGARRDALIGQIPLTVHMLQDAGLTVIVDLHTIPREAKDYAIDAIVGDAAVFDSYLQLVEEVAASLDGLDPTRTAFEPINEPTHDCQAIEDGTKGDWPDQLVRLHHAARQRAPDLPLVLSGACWGGIEGLEAIDPGAFADANVIWSFHSYDPFLFTHQSAAWTDAAVGAFADVPYPPSRVDDALAETLVDAAIDRARSSDLASMQSLTPEALEGLMDDYRAAPDDSAADAPRRAAAWATSHGISPAQLMLGEFGAIREDPEGRIFARPARVAFLQDKRLAAEAAGIAWSVWSWTGPLGIAGDDAKRDLDPDICGALGLAGC